MVVIGLDWFVKCFSLGLLVFGFPFQIATVIACFLEFYGWRWDEDDENYDSNERISIDGSTPLQRSISNLGS